MNLGKLNAERHSTVGGTTVQPRRRGLLMGGAITRGRVLRHRRADVWRHCWRHARPGGRFTGRLHQGLQARAAGLHLRPAAARDQQDLPHPDQSINVSKGGFGPVNQFNNVRKLNNPKSKSVVAPGSNALSSIAWLDLSESPQVLHVPRVHASLLRAGAARSLHRGSHEPRQRP